MTDESKDSATALIFPLIFGRIKEVQRMAEAAEICVAADNPDAALRILQDVANLTADAMTLSRAARLIRREREI